MKKMKIGVAHEHKKGKGIFVAITVVIVLASVMFGVVISAGDPGTPQPPKPTVFSIATNRTCILANGEAEALITARAVNDSGVPCEEGFLLIFRMMKGPSDAELINVSTGDIHSRTVVWDMTDEDGYAHAILRAGKENGTAVIHLSRSIEGEAIAETVVVIADHCEGRELVVTDIEPNPDCGFLFANESNYINATVKNIGTEDAGAFNVSFQVGDKTEEIRVPGLAANSSTQVAVLDPTPRVAGVNVTIRVKADCRDEVAEIDNDNNEKNVTMQVVNNGYKGKRYTGGGAETGNGDIDITTVREYKVRGGFLYSTGDSHYLSGSTQPWYKYTVNWSTADLSIPDGKDAEVKEARLYVYYTWDKVQGMPDNVSLRFNNITVERDAFYTDRKGYDGSDYPYGMLAYNVTGEFNNSGNTAVLENLNPVAGNPSIRGMLLVVIYESESGKGPECKIFVNEGFDLLYGGSDKCTTPEEATAYAPFTGAIEDTGNRSARLITVAPGASDEGELIFNGHEWSDVWKFAGDSQIGVNECDVTPYLNTTNVAAFQSSCDYMEASNAILVVGAKLGDTEAPVVTNPKATPSIIPDDTDNIPLPEASDQNCWDWNYTGKRWETSQLNVSVTDESKIVSVKINLSSLGGDAEQEMVNIPGTNIWTVITNASSGSASWNGTAYVPYQLQVNATDEYGNSNTVCIELIVMKNGDVMPYNGDGKVDFMHDALYLVRHTKGVPGYENIRDNIADVTGDGKVDFMHDALYLVRHTKGVPGYEILR